MSTAFPVHRGPIRQGRRVLNPQEGMLQQARALAATTTSIERDVVVEHRLARLVPGHPAGPLLR